MFNISNKTYDFLSKFQRFLPVLGGFYVIICEIWGTPFGEEVHRTITAFAAVLAGYLEISTAVYNKNKEAGIYFERTDEPNEDRVNHEKADEEEE